MDKKAVSNTETPPPVPQEYSATVSTGSLGLSVMAFLLSMYSVFRSKKIEKNSRFESAYGAPLMSLLRTFEKHVLKLQAFVFPTGKRVPDLKKEIEPLRIDLEVQSLEVSALLREIDKSNGNSAKNWEKTFTDITGQAETVMQAIAHPKISTEIEFRARVDDAKTLYQRSLTDIRALLDAERSKNLL